MDFIKDVVNEAGHVTEHSRSTSHQRVYPEELKRETAVTKESLLKKKNHYYA